MQLRPLGVDTSRCSTGLCSKKSRRTSGCCGVTLGTPRSSTGLCIVDTPRCSSGSCCVDTSRSSTSLCSADTFRCSSGPCGVNRSSTNLCSANTYGTDAAQCSGPCGVDTSRSSTGLCSADTGATVIFSFARNAETPTRPPPPVFSENLA
jgi:hypothetical protein